MSQIVSLLLRLILLPFSLIRMVGRLVARTMGAVLSPLWTRIDQSPRLSRLINTLSSSMATQRGLLLMIGTGIVLLSLLAHGLMLVVVVTAGKLDPYLYLLCMPFALLHVGVLAGFVGIMLAVPLGQGYKSQQQ